MSSCFFLQFAGPVNVFLLIIVLKCYSLWLYGILLKNFLCHKNNM